MKTGDVVEFHGGPWTFKDQGSGQRIAVHDGERGLLGLQKYPTAWEVHINGSIILADELCFSLVPNPNYTFNSDSTPVAEAPVPVAVERKLCDCSLHQLMHGGCKCGGK